MRVLRFGHKLNEEVCRGFILANLFNSLYYLLVRLWWNVLVANLATNFQDLVAKVKNLVALAPVLGEISRPEVSLCSWFFFCRFVLLLFASTTSQSYWSVSLRHKRKQILQNDRSIVSLNYSRLSSYKFLSVFLHSHERSPWKGMIVTINHLKE